MQRELTALEHRLYKFLDDVDSITEGELTASKWEKIRSYMRGCKEDCKTSYGVVNNGYSLHIELPFDVEKAMRETPSNQATGTFVGKDIRNEPR